MTNREWLNGRTDEEFAQQMIFLINHPMYFEESFCKQCRADCSSEGGCIYPEDASVLWWLKGERERE